MKTEYDAFANSYDLEYGQFKGDLDFYVGLAKAAQPPVLELACGTGRVTIPVARAGVPIAGVDSSPEMLARAREKVDSVGDLSVTLVYQRFERFDPLSGIPLGVKGCFESLSITVSTWLIRKGPTVSCMPFPSARSFQVP